MFYTGRAKRLFLVSVWTASTDLIMCENIARQKNQSFGVYKLSQTKFSDTEKSASQQPLIIFVRNSNHCEELFLLVIMMR